MSATSDRAKAIEMLISTCETNGEGQYTTELNLSAIRDLRDGRLEEGRLACCCPECYSRNIGISAIIPGGLTTIAESQHLDSSNIRGPRAEWGPQRPIRAITVLLRCQDCKLDSAIVLGGDTSDLYLTCPTMLRP